MITTNNNLFSQMRFVVFEFQPALESVCLSDRGYIEVRNGLNDSSPLIGTYCGGSQQPTDVIETIGSVMYVYFHSETFARFFAEYTSSEIGFPGMSSEEDDDGDDYQISGKISQVSRNTCLSVCLFPGVKVGYNFPLRIF